MTDLLKLAEFMEEQSHTSGDHHMQAAAALRELDTLRTKVNDLKKFAEVCEAYGRPSEMASMSHTQRIKKFVELTENL